MRLAWTADAWAAHLYWQTNDKKTFKRVNQLLRDTLRAPFDGIGKSEPLKYGADGAWSRRISQEHRLVYMVADGDLVILQARYHY